MSYLDGLPAYRYELPCGHWFRSLTRSEPDDESGCHSFYCRPCATFVAIPDHLISHAYYPPTHPSGMVMSDNQLVVRINAAIIKDRVAALYRTFWNTISVREAADMLGVSRRHVEAVAIDLGVYE